MIRDERGFTLIEILTVIVIIGLLMYFLLPNLGSVSNNTNVNVVETDLRTFKTGIQQHYIDNPDSPFTDKELKIYSKISFEKTSADGESLLKFKTIHKEDPWKNPYYLYVNNYGARYFMIHSYGPDGENSINGSDFGDDIVYLFYPSY